MKVSQEILENRMALFRDLCSEIGLRVTPQRQEVYRELARATDHPSAEMLHKRVTKRLPTMTLDTVYRTLGTLEKVGLVERVSIVASSARYEANTDIHHHFVCRKCGYILDIYSDRLNHIGLERDLPKGFQMHSSQVQLRGICPKCAK